MNTKTVNLKHSTEMSNFVSALKESKATEKLKIISNGTQKFICQTKTYMNTYIIEVTDGDILWLIKFDENNVDEQLEINGLKTIDEFFKAVSNGFSAEGTISVENLGSKIKLSIERDTIKINLDLFEAKAAEKKSEMQSLVLSLASRVLQLETELFKAKEENNAYKDQKSSNMSFSTSPVKNMNAGKSKGSKKGMSVVNPSNKKRKAATGVVFD